MRLLSTTNRSVKGITLLWVLLVACCGAQESKGGDLKNPFASSAEVIVEGKALFRMNCAPCHGIHANGGVKGPDLTAGNLAHARTDGEMYSTMMNGIAGTMMPANDLTSDEAWRIVTFLRSLQPPTTRSPSGDVARGKALYGDMKCGACHMVRGDGGVLGPDLSRVGASRSRPYMKDAIREPNKELSEGLAEWGHDFPAVYEKVIIHTRTGQSITGVLRNEDNFSIQMMDLNQNLRLLLKKDLQKVEHTRQSVMPGYDTKRLNDADLDHLLTYLETLRGQ